MSDLRHAFRRLARTPIFALAVSLTLSLAIGANATVFALLRGVVLNPLPYPNSNRLIELDHSSTVLRLSSGIGMTSDVVQRAFDPFFRADPNAPEGKGLGLSIVRRLGERFGWPVALESAPGEGTVAVIHFVARR